MGAAVAAVGSIFKGGGGSAGPVLDRTKFDYAKQVDDRTKESRDASLGLMKQLQGQAKGEGPSLADAQMKAAGNRSLQQQMAMAAAGRGGNAALRQRQVMAQGAQSGREIAEQSGIARMQEQQASQNMLAQLSQQQQAQDLQQVMDPAQGMMNYEQTRFAQDVARRNAVIAEQQALRGAAMSYASQAMGSGASNSKDGGGMGGMMAALGGSSDRNAKKDIKPGSKSISSFLDALSASDYKYKNPELPGRSEGPKTSVMAQDLEKSEVGRQMVKDTPHGKMVDYGQGFAAILAAQAELNKRLKSVEGKKRE